MRILHVLEANEGGTALHVRQLASLQAERHAVCVVTPEHRSWGRTDAGLIGDLRAAGVEVFPVDMRRIPVHPVNVVALATLVRLVRRWKPDVVHTHSSMGGVLGRLVAAIARLPAVHTQNGATFANAEGGASAAAGRILERMQRRLTDVAIAVSESEARVLRAAHIPERVVVVPNGLPSGDDPPSPFPEPPLIVSVGRFVHQKNPLLTVRVMAEARRRVPEARAMLVGYGELEDQVRTLIDQVDPAIEIRSDISGRAAVADASVMLLCSRYEGAPYVLLEAMERSRPVVATDVVGSRDVVADGETGLLFSAADPVRGGALVACLLTDVSKAARMGAAGRALFSERFTVETMAARVEAIYEEVVRDATPPRRAAR